MWVSGNLWYYDSCPISSLKMRLNLFPSCLNQLQLVILKFVIDCFRLSNYEVMVLWPTLICPFLWGFINSKYEISYLYLAPYPKIKVFWTKRWRDWNHFSPAINIRAKFSSELGLSNSLHENFKDYSYICIF